MVHAVRAYPCPVCGAEADLATGCPGCGRGPDPVAAEVVRLNAELGALSVELVRAREAYRSVEVALWRTRRRRDLLAGQVRAAAATARAAQAVQPVAAAGPAAASGPAATPVRPEASTRVVQNILFALGGLLVGAAAIGFTVVAWPAMGIAARAAVLAGLTALVLAVPVVARGRGLPATAETFAALGPLLVLLDGYAVWAVDLFDVASWPRVRYVALVLGVGALVAAGYRRLTRLAAPWFAGLLLLQPVPPLLAYDAGAGATGWTLAFAALAVVDLGLTRTRDDGTLGLVRRVVAWLGYGSAVLLAGLCALLALASIDGPGAVAAGVPLLVPSVLLTAGAVLTRHPGFGAVAAGLTVVALGIALLRAVVDLGGPALVGAALVGAVLAGAVVATTRLLPARVRPGAYAGGMVLVGSAATLAGLMALATGLATALRSLPPWRADLTAGTGPFDWQAPVALPVAVGALVPLLPSRGRRPAALTGAVLTVLALPTAVALPWWLPAVLSLGMAAALALVAVGKTRSGRAVGALAGAAAALAGHALLVGLARPAAAAGVLATTVLLGVTVAATAARPGTPPPPAAGDRGAAGPVPAPPTEAVRRVGGAALAVAVLATPAAVVVGLLAVGVPPWWQARAALAVTVPLTAAVLLRPRWMPAGYHPYASSALSAVTLAVGLAPALPGVDEPSGVYAAGTLPAAVALLAAGRGRRPLDVRSAASPAEEGGAPFRVVPLVSAAVLLARVAVAVTPAVGAVLVAPYAWLPRIWSGTPAGVGLHPGGWRPDVPAAVTLLLVATAAGVLHRARHGTWRRAAVPVASCLMVTVPAGLAAVGAPWPTVPATVFAGGLTALLGAAVSARVGRAARVGVPLGALLTGAGLAGLVPTRAGTIVGLAVLTAAGLAVGVAGRRVTARIPGWLAAVTAAVLLAVAGPRAADQPLRYAALLVLAVAAATVAGGVLLRRMGTASGAARPVREAGSPGDSAARTAESAGGAVPGAARRIEGAAVEVAGHGAALVAVALTAGAVRYTATVCLLWGVALGLRALRPTEPEQRRWAYVAGAGGAELFGVWLLLATARVAPVEAYTLSAALVGLLVGGLALRAWPTLSSWLGYGPGLGAALLPSLVSVLVADGQPLRRLLLGAGALVTVLVGARWRRQAPVVLGGLVLAVLAVREVVAVWDLLPRWIFLATGGCALIGLAVTYERRRRDLRRLRAAVGRMS